MKQLRIKIGDIFAVTLGGSRRRFFQYIANDKTQLNSSVIRVFKRTYQNDEPSELPKILNDTIDFYAHVFLRNGVKLGYWHKVGHIPEVGKIEVLFRCTSDLGTPSINVSDKWYVWRVNEPTRDIGKLTAKHRKTEMGIVFSPDSIVHRIRTGDYKTVYPE